MMGGHQAPTINIVDIMLGHDFPVLLRPGSKDDTICVLLRFSALYTYIV
jgi:hypothetical protein